MPANEGRGYVLRRIMRRGMRHAQLLGAREPLLWRMVPVLLDQMGKAFPELVRAEALITEVLKLEETSFRRTLERGLRLLEEETGQLPAGAAAGRRGRLQALRHVRLPARPDPGRPARPGPHRRHRRLRHRHGPPARGRARRLEGLGRGGGRADLVRPARERWAPPSSWATPPPMPRAWSRPWSSTASRSSAAEPGPVMVVTNQTPFYGESGGQIGDTGTIRVRRRRGHGHRHAKAAGRPVRPCRHARGRPARRRRRGRARRSTSARRDRIRRAHSATHLLHAALRRHLGQHVAQKGSLVAPDRLRFDFSQPRPMTPDEIRAVEAEVNALPAPQRRGARCGSWPATTPSAPVPWRCSARSMATRCASSRWARARTAGPTRSSCAAAPMSAAPATSPCSASPARVPSPPASAGSRR